MPVDIVSVIEQFRFKQATPEETQRAIGLFKEVYLVDNHEIPTDNLDAYAAYLIALSPTDSVAACLRIVGPTGRPFEVEKVCDFSTTLSPGRIPALVGRLSVRHEYRSSTLSILVQFGLFKLAIDYARHHGITDLILYTLPHLLNFYRSVFFRPTGHTFYYKPHRTWMHVMRLDLVELEAKLQAGSPRARLLMRKTTRNFLIEPDA